MLNVLIEVVIAEDVRGAITNDHLCLAVLLGDGGFFKQFLYLLYSFLSGNIAFDRCAALYRGNLEKVNRDKTALIDNVSAQGFKALGDDLTPGAGGRTKVNHSIYSLVEDMEFLIDLQELVG